MLRGQTSAQPGGGQPGEPGLFLGSSVPTGGVTEGRPPTEVANGHPPGTWEKRGGGPAWVHSSCTAAPRWGSRRPPRDPTANAGSAPRGESPPRERSLLQLGASPGNMPGDGSLVSGQHSAGRVRGHRASEPTGRGSKSGLMAAGEGGLPARLRAASVCRGEAGAGGGGWQPLKPGEQAPCPGLDACQDSVMSCQPYFTIK